MKTSLLKSKISFFLCFVLILFFTGLGYSQEEDIAKYPSRPITLIFPFTAGVSNDLLFRLIAKEAEKFIGQPIVVVNKVGGGGAIGLSALAASKPDGYTIGHCYGSPAFVIPFLEKVPYNTRRDFRQIIQFASSNMGVIVKADSPFKSFEDLVDYARQNPKKLSYGTAGSTGLPYFATEYIGKKAKVQFTNIPYKATSESEMALLGGHIQFAVGDFSYSLLDAGQTRLILLFWEGGIPEFSKIKCFKDLGYDFPRVGDASIGCPKAVPDGIVRKLEEAFTKGAKEPAFIKGVTELRFIPICRGSKEADEATARTVGFFETFFKEMGITK